MGHYKDIVSQPNLGGRGWPTPDALRPERTNHDTCSILNNTWDDKAFNETRALVVYKSQLWRSRSKNLIDN
ncbi:hypothetical protein RND71_003460 [Anisodus tanguticus]|uniref:Uncharacterized protein n=1 Tax=Anisodus tanguticus TaxID=243964 RepID=A0AAE1SWH3_9SOLA|nr:hypothetical protein RND71_003460 [Anisodus tanguticus]